MKRTFIFHKTKFTAKNRFVLAPMTHNMSTKTGDLSEEEIRWLNNCSKGGFGTLITAATLVQEGGRCWQGQPSLITKHQEQKFAKISQAANESNALVIVQLHHGGIRADHKLNDCLPVGPTKILPNSRQPKGVKSLKNNDIEALISAFVHSAMRAHKAGLHGIELHAAHNFLLCNFLNPIINCRTDEWGGSVENRSRIIVKIIEKVREQLPRDFLIGVRLSPESYGSIRGIKLENQIEVASYLASVDIDYIHFSMNDTFKLPNPENRSEINNGDTLLSLIKRKLGSQIPLLVAGKVTNIDKASDALNLGADLVAIGTAALGNPDWVKLSENGKELLVQPFHENTLMASGFNSSAIEYLRSIEGVVFEERRIKERYET